MKEYGFRKTGHFYIYETDFMEGNFHAILTVSEKGTLTGKVIDKMNDEEYRQLRSEKFNGPYVNAVRKEYKHLLESVGDAVCSDVFFAPDQANRITDLIRSRFDVHPDFPWAQDSYQTSGVFRHADTKKWFALILSVKKGTLLKNKDQTPIDMINLKTDTLEKDIHAYPDSIFPGYHMNHKTWLSLILDDSIKDETVMLLVRRSYNLTCI